MMMCERHNKKSEHGHRRCLTMTMPPAKEVVEKSNQLTSSLVARHPVTIMAIVFEF